MDYSFESFNFNSYNQQIRLSNKTRVIFYSTRFFDKNKFKELYNNTALSLEQYSFLIVDQSVTNFGNEKQDFIIPSSVLYFPKNIDIQEFIKSSEPEIKNIGFQMSLRDILKEFRSYFIPMVLQSNKDYYV